MAQTGYTPIQLYRSTTASAAPTGANLAAGELAINTTDEKLYFKNAAGTVKLLAANVTPVANGGTGLTTTPTNGQIDIGNGTGFSRATLTAGSNVTITNGAGSITIAASGTVTSVGVSGGTTGLTTSGGPVTGSGTITLAGTLAVTNGGTGLTTTPSNGQIDIGNGTGFSRATLTAGSGISITNGAGSITLTATAQQPFAPGTIIVFGQTAAPTGWTKITTYDNAALRIVSGSAASGGSVDFTTAFASQAVSGSIGNTTDTGTVGSTTLTTAQIPSHTHTALVPGSGGCGSNGIYPGDPATINTGATGGGGSHNHSLTMNAHNHTFTGTAINLAVKYVDVIFASKD
jgi:hypothetical protein